MVEFDIRLEEAARTVGANEQQAIFQVVMGTNKNAVVARISR